MYIVTIYDGVNDQTGIVIHSPFPNSVKLSSGSVKKVVKGISSMSFAINLNNPGWGKIKPYTTLIKVTNLLNNKTIFNGRVLKPVQAMTSSGLFSIEYACEDNMAFLQDSNQRFGEYHNISVKDFFTVIIENHNRQVEPHKRFIVGNVTVIDPNDSLYRYLGYEKTFATIKDKLIDRLGGFLVIREEVEGNYIDYLDSVGTVSNTAITLRKNLKDMKRDIDPTGIISRLVVLGAQIESENPDDTGASQARVDIKSVNNGLDYIDDPDLIAEFGIIEDKLEFDDISIPSTLMSKGQQFFVSQKAAKVTYSVTPVDVSLIDNTFDSFEVGNWHPIVNPVFGIDELLQIIEQDINIVEPTRTSLTIGEKYKTLTQYQIDANKAQKNVVELQSIVNRQSKTISNIKNQMQSVEEAVENVRLELDASDLPALENAIADLNITVDNLIDAIDEIPVYEPATQTTDGLMSSTDKVKLDELQNYTNATDIQDGLMPAGDKEKIDLITVSAPIDLDNLLERLEAVENAGGTETTE